MPLPLKRWQIEPPVSDLHLARFPDLPPLVVQLLHNREIDDPGTAQGFLTGRLITGNPFQLKGMNEAVGRLRKAIRGKERIAVYGDFDTDGVTATVLLVQALSALGAAVEPYIPHRVDEGYGLNLGALRHLHRKGVRVVVTVDCGIRSIYEVEQARGHLDLIITDHHSVGGDLPPAVATVNPKQPGCRYPFEDLAGVGVAFKLAEALFLVQRQLRQPLELGEDSLLDLVALGTVADLAPLLDENRSLVRRGLEALNEPARPGVEALMADAGLRRGEVDATAIGFRLGPRLNAAGRLDTAMLAYQLLTNPDPLETRELAEKLSALNQRRQELTEQTVAAAEAQVLADDPDAPLYLVAGKDFLPGIVGLAASRLTEAHYRPSVVVELGEQESRGSCRSIAEFNITTALDGCKDLLIRYGGHAAAAGFTVATDKLHDLRQRLQAIAAEQLAGIELRPTLKIDVEMPLEEVNWATHALLGQLEPCGADNPQPVLVSRDLEMRDRRLIGSDQKHLKLTLRDGRGVAWDAIAFRQGDLLGQVPDRVDVAYTLDVNEWNHEKRLHDLAAVTRTKGRTMQDKLEELKARFMEIADLNSAAAVLSWDQTTYMPPGGAKARARQTALLRRLSHEKLTDPAVGGLLDSLQPYGESLPYDSDEASLIRVARRNYEKAVRVPPSLVAEMNSHQARSYQIWAEARPANDFAAVQPYLEKTLDLSRQLANCFPGYEHIADPLIDYADYGMKASTLRALFAELREQLVPIVQAITAQPAADDSCLHQTFPETQQWDFGLEVVRRFGYDMERGRQDKTPHPFTIRFSSGDVRITTRFRENDLGDALFSTMHEAGHAMYEQGIRADLEGTPLARGTSSGVHESQSRLWENLVGRSRGFWQFFYPRLQAIFPGQLGSVSLDTFYRAINKVKPSLIRVDADEVTYNLHVMLRFDFELALLEGKLAVRDLPEAWRERFKTDLGIVPPDDRDGVLQDVHWYDGRIGGVFQGYTLGNILSAQFFEAALRDRPEIPGDLTRGEFGALHGWLKEALYQHGSKFTAAELVERVSGRPMSIEPYIRYLRAKYGELYAL